MDLASWHFDVVLASRVNDLVNEKFRRSQFQNPIVEIFLAKYRDAFCDELAQNVNLGLNIVIRFGHNPVHDQ